MSQENINTARALHHAFAEKNLAQAASLVDDAFEWKIVAFGMTLNGQEGFRQGFENFASPFPDSRLDYKNVLDNGEQVVVEYDFVGTHNGTLQTPLGPVSATGRPIHLAGIEVFRLRGGKIISLRTYFDSATLMAQLGLMSQ